MLASEAAQEAVQAAAHAARSRVTQPVVLPVLVQTPSLGIASARGSSTDASNHRTHSLGIQRTSQNVAPQ